MPVAYDLVIIGGAPEGRTAAIAAATTGARVALVEPPGAWQQSHQLAALQQALRHSIGWAQLPTWVTLKATITASARSAAAIAALGVDVITGEAQFLAGNRPQLQVPHRCLSARAYLLATGPIRPPIEGQTLSPAQLLQLTQPPQTVALLGARAAEIEWAFALSAANIQVRLLAERCLPAEDTDIQRLLRHQLMAVGVVLNPIDKLEKIKSLDQQTQLWIEGTPTSVDHLLSLPNHRAWVAQLDLAAVGLSLDRGRLKVNRWLQTAHPRIYAVGALLGGEDRPVLAELEAQAAVQNALFWRRRRLTYRAVTYGLQGLSEVGRAGLSEQQARSRYGSDRLQIVSASALPPANSQYAVNFCKLISLDSHQIIGMHLMGNGAIGLAAALGLSLRQRRLTVTSLAEQPAAPQTLAALVQQTASQLQQRRWQVGQWQRDWAENWFNWRRSRR
ncbi:MAG: NAD(P)/FAD-dependent oxidoreductase [Leptolyngbya sp. SIO4C1]|nr:NAD(P)/FAD-dependent oxidoreductase [Leptolyngbya sp. SIO4C1]